MRVALQSRKPQPEPMKRNEPNETHHALHVVLGAGQVGALLADHLLAAGHRVRVVRKSRRGVARPNLEVVFGDTTDLAFAEHATRGAAVVYDCTNPQYWEWPQLLLPLGRGALHGATKAGARLVALDCLYMYGRPNGPMTETTPMRPVSKKGAMRRELAELRLGAVARGDAHVSIARGSDFFGPAIPLSVWGDRFYERVFAGKAAECMGDPNILHSYTYVPDVVRALAMLGSRDDTDGVWHVPTLPAESTAALARRLGAALDRKVDLVRVPKLVMRGLGLFSPFLREAVEMMYQWEIPYVLDDTKFRTKFCVDATPMAEQIAATSAWATQRFVARAA